MTITIVLGKKSRTTKFPHGEDSVRVLITMKMLDVTNDAQHKKDVSITLSPRVDMAAYQKPVSDMNIAIGHGDFISLENFHRGKRYVTNETLFIKIISITKPELNNACEFA